METKRNLREIAESVMPAPVIKVLRSVIRRARKQRNLPRKHWRAWKAPLLHKRLLEKHRGARPIRVMFLISNTASWKVGPVFSRMLEDEDFMPVAVVCPVVNGLLSKIAEKTSESARQYLDVHGFPYIDLTKVDAASGSAEIERIDPHLVFFTNPHRLTPEYLHDDLFRRRLTCYVPYNHEVMTYGGNEEQHNKESHNAFWKIFAPHDVSRQYYAETRIRGDTGITVTGFPACEPLLVPVATREPSPWQAQPQFKKRVIYAPHWLSHPDIKMATIDAFGEVLVQLANAYRDEIQWALRPHPMLKPRLMQDPNWGPARTEAFFDFWKNSAFSQLHEGDYVDLFRTSDAMIHDSGSFLAEYLYLRKPVMYLMTEHTGGQYFNPFGRRAISACEIGRKVSDIERFLEDVLADSAGNMGQENFFDADIAPLFEIPPSVKICDDLRRAFS